MSNIPGFFIPTSIRTPLCSLCRSRGTCQGTGRYYTEWPARWKAILDPIENVAVRTSFCLVACVRYGAFPGSRAIRRASRRVCSCLTACSSGRTRKPGRTRIAQSPVHGDNGVDSDFSSAYDESWRGFPVSVYRLCDFDHCVTSTAGTAPGRMDRVRASSCSFR